MTIPDQLLVVSKDNFVELYREAYHKDPDKARATNALLNFSHYETDSVCYKLCPANKHSSTIRKLAMQYGFTSFKTDSNGGSAFNVKKGVRVLWRYSWYTAEVDQSGNVSAVGYAFDRIWFEVRKAKTKYGWKMAEKYTYTETSYDTHEQGFSFVNQKWLDLTANEHNRSSIHGVRTYTSCKSAARMFEEAFNYGQTLQGDEAVTENTLKKKMLQNIIMTSVFDSFKNEVYGEGSERCRIKLNYGLAKAPEDSCTACLTFVPASPGSEPSPLMPFLVDHHRAFFELSSSSFGIGYGNTVKIDFNDPAFDIDKLKAVVSKAIKRHYETVLLVSNHRLQIKGFKTLIQGRDADDRLVYQQELVDAFCEPAS